MPRVKKAASKKAAESDGEGRPTRSKRAPNRLDPVPGRDSTTQPAGTTKRGRGRPKKSERGQSQERAIKTTTKKRKADQEFEVEKFIGCQLLVKWKNYPKSSATWEPIENLLSCDAIVRDYLDTLKQQVLDAADEREEGEEVKPPPAKKGRGRPRKSDVAASEAEEEQEGEQEEPATPKRGRGRPPKKAKTDEEKVAEEKKDDSEEEEDDEKAEKSEEKEDKKEASSSQKGKTSKPVAKASEDEEGEAATTTPRKRGRGRPPKEQKQEKENHEEDAEQDVASTPTKRGRGRPPKKAKTDEENNAKPISVEIDDEEA